MRSQSKIWSVLQPFSFPFFFNFLCGVNDLLCLRASFLPFLEPFSSALNSRKGEDMLKRLKSVGAVEASGIDRIFDVLYGKKLDSFNFFLIMAVIIYTSLIIFWDNIYIWTLLRDVNWRFLWVGGIFNSSELYFVIFSVKSKLYCISGNILFRPYLKCNIF